MNVTGDNNRVAGRDYIENPIKPCPVCETRVISRDMHKCKHCEHEEKTGIARFYLLIFGICVFFVFGWVGELRADAGTAVGFSEIAESFGYSVLIVFVGWLVLSFAWDVVRPVLADWLKKWFS